MQFESGKELQRGLSSGVLSIAAKKGRSITLHGLHVLLYGLRVLLRLVGYIVFFVVAFGVSVALGSGIALAFHWWLDSPDLVCISIQDCYELLF